MRRSETLEYVKSQEEVGKQMQMRAQAINAAIDAKMRATQDLATPKLSRAPPSRRHFDPRLEPPRVVVPPIEEDARILLITESSRGKIISQPISAHRILSVSAPELRPPPNQELLKLSLALIAQADTDPAEMIASIPIVRKHARRKPTAARLSPLKRSSTEGDLQPMITTKQTSLAAAPRGITNSMDVHDGAPTRRRPEVPLNLLDEKSVQQFRKRLNRQLDRLSRAMHQSEPTLPTLARKVVPMATKSGGGKGPKPLPHLKWEKYAAEQKVHSKR